MSKPFPDLPVVMAICLLVAGCAAGPRVAGPRPQPAGQDVESAIPPAPPEVSPTPPTEADLAADPSRFKGLGSGDVLALLGDPNFRRLEAPAEEWQYYGKKCVLDLFLYDDAGARHVVYAEVRSRTAGEGDACVTGMLAAHKS
jgi:hypothetical protein